MTNYKNVLKDSKTKELMTFKKIDPQKKTPKNWH